MFRNVLFGCVALVAGSGVVVAAAQDDVKAAAQKLADSQNYSWKTTMQAGGGGGGGGRGGFGGGPSEGKVDKDGTMIVTITRGDNETQIVKKGDKAAIKTPDNGWKTPAELAQDQGQPGPGRFMGRMVQGMQPPAKTAEELVADAKELTPSASGDGWSGPLSEDGAKKAMMPGGRRGGGQAQGQGPQVTNAKGDVKFYTKDGVLAGYELHVTGSIDFNGNTRDIDRTTTVQISDVGSTKVEIPDEAKKKLEE